VSREPGEALGSAATPRPRAPPGRDVYDPPCRRHLIHAPLNDATDVLTSETASELRDAIRHDHAARPVHRGEG
jgi:hypothetical protein